MQLDDNVYTIIARYPTKMYFTCLFSILKSRLHFYDVWLSAGQFASLAKLVKHKNFFMVLISVYW